MTAARWYALTTQPRHEKVVAELLQHKGLEVYLPLSEARSRWKDRTVTIHTPVFPGYVFVKLHLEGRYLVYSTPGVVRILSFYGSPAVIDDAEIHALRLCLSKGSKPELHPYFEAGHLVRITSGALTGVKGIVMRHKDQSRIIVSVTMIRQSVSVEIDSKLLERVAELPAVAFSTQS